MPDDWQGYVREGCQITPLGCAIAILLVGPLKPACDPVLAWMTAALSGVKSSWLLRNRHAAAIYFASRLLNADRLVDTGFLSASFAI